MLLLLKVGNEMALFGGYVYTVHCVLLVHTMYTETAIATHGKSLHTKATIRIHFNGSGAINNTLSHIVAAADGGGDGGYMCFFLLGMDKMKTRRVKDEKIAQVSMEESSRQINITKHIHRL